MSHLPDVFAIISTLDTTKVDFSQVPEENNQSLRYSLDLNLTLYPSEN